MLYKIPMRLMVRRCFNMTFKATEIPMFALRITAIFTCLTSHGRDTRLGSCL